MRKTDNISKLTFLHIYIHSYKLKYIDELINQLEPIEETYSTVGKNLNYLYSNKTIEKLKIHANKKVKPAFVIDEIKKMKNNDLEKRQKSQYDKYISIQTKIKNNKIPPLRKLNFQENLPESSSIKTQEEFQFIDDINGSDSTTNARADAELKLQEQKEYERYLFLRRYNENRFMKLMKLRKDKGEIPAPGQYSPNYNVVTTRKPNVIFDYPIYGPNKVSTEVFPPMKSKPKSRRQQPLKQHENLNRLEHELTDKTAHTIDNEEENINNNLEIDDVYEEFDDDGKSQNKKKFILPKVKHRRKSSMSSRDMRVDILSKNKIKKSESVGFLRGKIQSVFFDKMIGRKEEKLIQKAPAAGTYNPRYDCVNKNIQNVLFDGVYSKDESHYKKMLIHKVIHSYNINEDYSVMKMKWKSFLKEKKKQRTRETKIG